MKDVLFRGKCVDVNKWAYGFLYITTSLQKEKTYWIFTETNKYKIIPETAGQYTGIKGKGRKKIFENDILEVQIRRTSWDDQVNITRRKNDGYYFVNAEVYFDKYKLQYRVKCDEKRISELKRKKGKEQIDAYVQYPVNLCDCEDLWYGNEKPKIIGNIHDNNLDEMCGK